MPSFVTHLEAAIDGTELPGDRPQTLHNDRPLWVRYDLQPSGERSHKEALLRREPTMWRYRELLPPAGRRHRLAGRGHVPPSAAARRLGERFGY